MLKFFADRGGADHGGDLSWPGTADGFPVRGPVPNLKQEEYQDIPLALDFKSERFCLWVPEEKARFEIIMDRVINGWYMQHKRVDRWSDDHCGMVVWLEWAQIYGETAAAKHPGIQNDDDESTEI